MTLLWTVQYIMATARETKAWFPRRVAYSGEAGLSEGKGGPETLLALNCQKWTKTGDFPNPILGLQCMCMCLCNAGALGPNCASFSCGVQHYLQKEVPLMPTKFLTIGSAVPGGRKFEGWSPAELSLSLTGASRFSLVLTSSDRHWLGCGRHDPCLRLQRGVRGLLRRDGTDLGTGALSSWRFYSGSETLNICPCSAPELNVHAYLPTAFNRD